MNYCDVMDYIRQISGCGIVPGLDSIKRLCDRLGNPQDRLQFVHIAGTNGKGSVLAFVSTVLSCGGYNVGRYISPTIFEYRERIQLNGSCISEEELCEGMEIVKAACDKIVNEGVCQPTPFEVETALAFWYFERKQCDIVVLETGMGGAADATNIIGNTLVAAITSVGMDHMKFLGNTLGEIARQKAGIIKKGCSVVIMKQDEEVLGIIRNVAEEYGCKFVVSDIAGEIENNNLSNIKYGLDGQAFDYGDLRHIMISLCGKFQIDNAVLALNVIYELKEKGFVIPENAIRNGFYNTEWQGRFQILRHRPYFIVDGAHNEDAAKKLINTLDLYFTNRRFIYIMGMLSDKECEDVVCLTTHYADMIITVTPPNTPRALSAGDLARIVEREVARDMDLDESVKMTNKISMERCVRSADSIEAAVELAFQVAEKDDVILAFGSLSILGEIINIVKA